MAKAGINENGDYEGASNKKQQGYKRSKGGCLNCKFRKVKCDEIKPTCTACLRLAMPCGNYGATLSKPAYAEQKQDFLEQVRRKGMIPHPRTKRPKKSLPAEEEAQREQLQMQLQLGLANVLQHSPEDMFHTDGTQDFYDSNAYNHEHLDANTEDSNNLFEINPTAAIQQLQQISAANHEHDLQAAELAQSAHGFEANNYTDPSVLGVETHNEPYVPNLMTIDRLMSQQQHVMQAEQQRAAEEAAVRARKDETLAQRRRMQSS